MQILSQNKFSSLLDAISIFITGAEGIPADIPNKHISQYTVNDVIQLIDKRDLKNLGLTRSSKVRKRIKDDRIDGAKIIENLNIDAKMAENVDIDGRIVENIKDLFFTQELQGSMQEEDINRIASAIIRTVQFMLLKHRIEEEYIPKFQQSKQIAALRLNYYFTRNVW